MRAAPTKRHVLYKLYPVLAGCWLFGPTRSHTTTLQPTITKKGVPFSTRRWPTGPWHGQPGTSQCDKSSQSQQLFFALLISMQVYWSRQLQTVSPRSGSPTLKKGSCVRVVRGRKLLSVRSYPTGVMPAVRLVRPWMNRDTKHFIGASETGASRGRGV